MTVFEEYRKKRKFDVTPEPLPKDYNTALLSFAIPKAKIPEPGERVLAIETELHPIEYIHFEGKIPATEYGGGIVKVYDRGKYKILEAEKNKLVFELDGERTKGKFVLIHLKKDQYLLIKLKE